MVYRKEYVKEYRKRHYVKEKRKKEHKEYYQKNRDKILRQRKERYQKNKKKILLKEHKKRKLFTKVCKYCSKEFKTTRGNKIFCCRKCSKIYCGKRYYKKHKKELQKHKKEYGKKYYQENKEDVDKKNKKYSNKNPEKIKKYAKKYNKTEKGKLLRIRRNTKRKALKKKAKDTLTKKELKVIIERDKRCIYCKTNYCKTNKNKNPTFEHIISLKSGGEHSFLNGAIACFGCNSSKKDREVFEWCKSKGYKVPKIVIDNLKQMKGGKK